MRKFILALLFFPFISKSQSILDDKKDPFTNVRTITTGINPLYKVSFTPILQVQSQIEVQNDSITTYRLNFVTPGLTMVINNKDSVVNACYLKDENGSIYTGTLKTEVAGVVVGRSYQGYTCILTKDDFYKIIALNITDVKITADSGKGGLFPVDKRSQDNISRQAKMLLDEYKAYTLKQ